MTTEERLTNLEEVTKLLTNNLLLLTDIVQYLKTETVERKKQTEERHRDSVPFQRLLIYIARKNGWLEQGEWPDPE